MSLLKKIWVGTDAGVYVYNPLLEDFTVFDRVSDTGDMISRNDLYELRMKKNALENN